MFLSYDTASTATNVSLQYFPTAAQAPLWRVQRSKKNPGEFTLVAVTRPAGAGTHLAASPWPCNGCSIVLARKYATTWAYSGGNLTRGGSKEPSLLLLPSKPVSARSPPPEKDGYCYRWDCGGLQLRESAVGGLAWRFIPRQLPPTRPDEVLAPFWCATIHGTLFDWAFDDGFAAAKASYQFIESKGYSLWFWQRTASGWRQGDLNLPVSWQDELKMRFGKEFLAVMAPARLLFVPKADLESPPLVFNISGFQLIDSPEMAVTSHPIPVAADGPNVAVSGRYNGTNKPHPYYNDVSSPYYSEYDPSYNVPPAVPFVAIYTLVDSSKPLLASSWTGPAFLNFTAQPEVLELGANGTTLAVGLSPERIYNSTLRGWQLTGPARVKVFHQRDHDSPWIQEADIPAPFKEEKYLSRTPFSRVALSGDHLAVFFTREEQPVLSFYRRNATGVWNLIQQITPPIAVNELVMDGEFTAVGKPVVGYRWSESAGQWVVHWSARSLPRRDKIFINPNTTYPTYPSYDSPILHGEIALSGGTFAVPAMFNYFTDRQSPWTIFMYKL